MESLMAETVQEKHWYLAVGDRSIGPLTTELVTRGIESGKVPLTAWICQVGADAWSALSSFGEFQDVVDRVLAAEVPANQQSRDSNSKFRSEGSAAPSAPSSGSEGSAFLPTSAATGTAAIVPDSADEDEATGQHAVLPYEQQDSQAAPAVAPEARNSDFVTSAASVMPEESPARDELPSLSEHSGEREILPELRRAQDVPFGAAPADLFEPSREEPFPFALDEQRAAARAAAGVSHDDLGIDITFDEDHENAIDWKERFQSYFLVGTEVELPEERRLLQSLRETPRAIFLHDEALWNLALCLAFGPEKVADTSAQTFFEAVALDGASERVEWICRTLLSKGFMPSGIPRSEGMRGIRVLREFCPVELREVLERESLD